MWPIQRSKDIPFLCTGLLCVVYKVIPHEIIVQKLCGNPIKTTHKSFQLAMIAVDMLNVINALFGLSGL
jgi:hypothetical protein